MNKKWSIETVRSLFKDKNCVLLSETYVNTTAKLNYIAQCGHEHQISLDNFRKGKGLSCRECRYKKMADDKTFSYEEVKHHFVQNGCELIDSEYKDSQTKLNYIAQCGHENKVTFNKFKQGAGRVCNVCSKSIRYTYDYVREYFANKGCLLLSDTYTNVKQPLRFIAQCGHEHKLSFSSFQSPNCSYACKQCGKKKEYTIEGIKQLFENDGCKVIDDSYDYKKINYIACCGHRHTIKISKFLSGQGRECPKCSRPKGDEHHNFNPDLTDEERYRNRDLFENIQWRNKVYARDNYTCQNCNSKKGKFNAHHKEAYNLNEEKRFDIDNGVTLCETCHQDFHKKFGYGNNTEEQYNEWLHSNKYADTEVNENITRHRNA